MVARAPAPEEVVGLLASPVRRRIVAALDVEPLTLPELVRRLDGSPSKEVVEAVERLLHAGVIERAPGDDVLRLVDDVFQRSVRDAATERTGDLNDEQTRVFRRYFFRNRLLQIPSEPWALEAVLDLVAEDFQPGVDYGEREVNTTLYGWHGDWAALRRLLVDSGRVTRSAGVYRRAGVTDDTVTAPSRSSTVDGDTR